MEKKPLRDARTRIYIDGYNLYYGCLKGTCLKWLDLKKLFQDEILSSIMVEKDGFRLNPVFGAGSIQYFTAKIIESAARSIDSVSCQAKYHRALSTYLGDQINIIEGYYALNKMAVRVVDGDDPEKPPKDCERIQAWKLEEKQTDVNIAIHSYHDAMCGEIDHAVFVTNDTDISTALKFIKKYTDVTVGVIIPTRDSERRPNQALVEHADWTREHIREEELKLSQLPLVIPAKRKPVTKPDSWYPNHEIFKEILELSCMIKGSRSKAFQWLKSEQPYFGGKSALDLIEDKKGAEHVLEYIKKYISAHLRDTD